GRLAWRGSGARGPPGEGGGGLGRWGVVGRVGGLGGVWRGKTGRHSRRYETLVTIQRTLADAAPLDLSLARLQAALADRLRVDAIALVARDDERLVVAGGGRGAEDSLVARVLPPGGPPLVGATGENLPPRPAPALPPL